MGVARGFHSALAYDVGDGPSGIEISIGAGIPILSHQLCFIANIRCGEDELSARTRTQLDACLSDGGLTAAAGGNRVAVDCDHLHGLGGSVNDVLEIKDGVSGGVGNAP